MANADHAPSTANFPAGMSQPSIRALASAGITHFKQLTKFTEAEIAKLHGMGPRGVRILKEAMQEKGMNFKAPKP